MAGPVSSGAGLLMEILDTLTIGLLLWGWERKDPLEGAIAGYEEV